MALVLVAQARVKAISAVMGETSLALWRKVIHSWMVKCTYLFAAMRLADDLVNTLQHCLAHVMKLAGTSLNLTCNEGDTPETHLAQSITSPIALRTTCHHIESRGSVLNCC
jgi:hypothetical protein